MNNHIKVLSMNVRGLSSNSKKILDVFNWAKSKNASIVCFQETHSTKDIETRWEDEWSGKCYFSHGDSKSAGVSIMFRSGLDFKVNDLKIDENGRYIILDLTVYEQRLTFVCMGTIQMYHNSLQIYFINLQNLQIQVIYFVMTGMQYKTKVTIHTMYFMTEI